MKPIRLGMVGTMHDHAEGKLVCVKKFPQQFEILGCVAEHHKRQEEIQDREPYLSTPFLSKRELRSLRPDAVLIECAELDLIDEAMEWVERGVSVHIDKPAGASVKDLEKLYRVAERTGAKIQFAYMYRYNTAILDCISRIERGEMGEIYQVDAVMDTCLPPEKRQWLSHLPGGIQFYLGCHMIDLVYRLQGLPLSITPFLKSTGFDGVKAIDHGFASFEYPHGVSVARATATEINGYGNRRLLVCGSEGTYEIEPLENPTIAYFTPKSESQTYADCRQRVELPPYDPACRYDDMMFDFASFVRQEKVNPFDRDYEVTLQKLLMFCCGKTDIDWKH